MVIGNGGKFNQWMSNGLLATIAWFILLVIYCTFKAKGIEDPTLGNAFILVTGAWVGMLTLAQGRKNAKTEEKAEEAKESAKESEKKVDELIEEAQVSKQRANDSELRADASERREKEWSQHRDHHKEDDKT